MLADAASVAVANAWEIHVSLTAAILFGGTMLLQKQSELLGDSKAEVRRIGKGMVTWQTGRGVGVQQPGIFRNFRRTSLRHKSVGIACLSMLHSLISLSHFLQPRNMFSAEPDLSTIA